MSRLCQLRGFWVCGDAAGSPRERSRPLPSLWYRVHSSRASPTMGGMSTGMGMVDSRNMQRIFEATSRRRKAYRYMESYNGPSFNEQSQPGPPTSGR